MTCPSPHPPQHSTYAVYLSPSDPSSHTDDHRTSALTPSIALRSFVSDELRVEGKLSMRIVSFWVMSEVAVWTSWGQVSFRALVVQIVILEYSHRNIQPRIKTRSWRIVCNNWRNAYCYKNNTGFHNYILLTLLLYNVAPFFKKTIFFIY